MYQIIETDSNNHIRTVAGLHKKAVAICHKLDEIGFCGWTPSFMLKKVDLNRYTSNE